MATHMIQLKKCPRPNCNGDLQIVYQDKSWHAECLLCDRTFDIDRHMRNYLHQTHPECEVDGIPTTASPMQVHYHRINQRY